MKIQNQIVYGVLFCMLGGTAQAQVNQWRGGETAEDWNDQYKWKEKHVPTGEEATHFREKISVIKVNSTVQLNNGMHLYGEELSLLGNGNINLWSQLPHERTINIPASATGFANLTLNDNLSVNGRIALSAKGFGTSASKGSITLKDRSNVTGALCVGNTGTGTGQVFVKDNSTYRITGLELSTKAESGGSAQIHILGGTVRIETKENPFAVFLEDASRKLIIGDAGTLRFEYNMPIINKKTALKALIEKDRIVAAPGCRLTAPVIQDKLVMIRAEDERNESPIKSKADLLAAIDRIAAASTVASSGAQPRKLESLLQNMRSDSGPSSAPAPAPAPTPAAASATPLNPAIASLMQQKGVSTAPAVAPTSTSSGARMAGYIAFFGATLLVLRRAPSPQIEEDANETEQAPAVKSPKPANKKKRKR
ncbi:hypothetical protein P4E94_16095 [Pontiellaceae bacterium B12219]|nr:hypothetical protein [Pontiellaceae bacterium B12219]